MIEKVASDKPSLKDRFESHPLIFGISLLLIGFVSGIAFSEWTMTLRSPEPLSQPRGEGNVSPQVRELTAEHNRRLDELHKALAEQEKQAVYGGNLDQTQKKHVEAAERIRKSIVEENSSYKTHLEQLMRILDARGV